MSFWSRLTNVFRGERLSREIDEELQSHIDEAIREGRDAAEARRAFGAMLQRREESLDQRLFCWLDSLRADAVFGWRQLMKRKVTSAAAVLSLALAIGACTSAFRLIDALLLRPLPVASPERLYVVAFENIGADGTQSIYDSSSYPMFRRMRDMVRDQAECIAVSYTDRVDLTYGSDQEMEKAYREYVSGWMFDSFGLRPSAGRLLTANDDGAPGAHPVAVLSYDYWSRRFARDPNVVGRTFHMGDGIFEIVGVAGEGFVGTETGFATDVFVPMAMKTPRTLASSNNFWLRTLVQLKPGVAAAGVQEQLRATFRTIQEERAGQLGSVPIQLRDSLFREKMLLEPAASGRSNLQRDYRRSLMALGILVILVLLIACANVANLMTARAAARAREMALRVSIGAGRARLVQLVLTESAWLALLSAAIGVAFAWWSAPVIVGKINSADNPASLTLTLDWRVLAFALALSAFVMFLFGLMPALRASAVKPASAIRGGDDPHARRRVMHALIAVQVAFCFIVQFAAGLFVATSERISNQPTGFSADRILNLETVAPRPQPAEYWSQVAAHLRGVPGVEKVGLSVYPVMSGESNVGAISINGAAPGAILSDILQVAPEWVDTLRISWIDGRDFRSDETGSGVAIVNQAFARQFFEGGNPVGKWFEKVEAAGVRQRYQVIGYIRDARTRDDLRRPIRPTAYLPFQASVRGAFVVRTAAANPLAMASTLRLEVARARPEFRVSNIRTQWELVRARNVRERLLATLAWFFGCVALLLAGIGLYGVLDYSVLQRRREIGIRLAIGARPGHIARGVTVEAFVMVLAGAAAGLGLGMALVRYVTSLLFDVKPTDLTMLAAPSIAILVAALLAALPAVIRAVRIDPVTMLRSE
ncbi:MAG TPA: ADOP family duplicated permease [Candidatus Sulfopaludibacter sp.]|jgi:predicted permease|nr:ADOP family duplicated permease [Candidatus Sulfopaludibacter sp.]